MLKTEMNPPATMTLRNSEEPEISRTVAVTVCDAGATELGSALKLSDVLFTTREPVGVPLPLPPQAAMIETAVTNESLRNASI